MNRKSDSESIKKKIKVNIELYLKKLVKNT